MAREMKKNCLICNGLITVKELANMPIENLSHKEPICKKHIEEIEKAIMFINRL